MENLDKDFTNQGSGKDDALFEALGKARKRKRRKVLIIVLSIVLVLGTAAFLGVRFLQRRVREAFASAAGEVQSYQVTTGAISTVVSGSGSLTDVDLEAVTVPEGVEITQVLVKTNDAIKTGDVLAAVDMSTVMSTMAQVQSEIEDLDDQISAAEDDEADDVIYAGVTGRVKVIFAGEGDEVLDIMVEHGALALLSLDGYMAVDVQTSALTAGDSVTVVLSDGDEVTGTVEGISGDTATILVTDNGTLYQEEVTVLSSENTQIGTGSLYIHSPMRITAYAGAVEAVKTSLNKKVSDTTKLFTLEDTAYSANYETLLCTRGQKEETLLELLTIQRDGAVLAKQDGSVYSVDYSDGSSAIATLSADEKMSVTIDVDEADILALELGQEVDVTISSVSEDAFAGTLTQINRTSASSGVYSAVVELEKTEEMLSGMTASVSVRIEGVDDAIIIPVEALNKTRDGAYVYTSYDEQTQEYGGRVDVVTGLESSSYVEIKSGLSVGDTVYYTEAESFFGSMGNMGNMGNRGNVGDNFGMQMPNMPNGGEMPSGEMPSGEMPGGNRGSRSGE